MIIKNQHIGLVVREVVEDAPGYWSVFFTRPAHFVFSAGDWIDIHPEHQELKGGTTYSVSSSPTESGIRISFRTGISELKRVLQSAVVGDQFYISQYGNDYDFRLKPNQSSVLIAGGIGIAPFRSMLKQASDTKDANSVILIYLNQSENFLFKDELDEWSRILPNLTIQYIVTKDINRKKRQKLILELIKNKDQNFYIAGPPQMVESNEHLLIDAGVPVRNIRIDSFGGY